MKTSTQINDLWSQVTEYLEAAGLNYGHGASDAKSEALWLISSALGFPPEDVLEELESDIDPTAIEKAWEYAQQRAHTRQPLAYILGEASLMGVPFYCDERSIVPRSYIAELIVDGHLEEWLPPGAKVLDLCTGNGSLAILLALACPDVNVSGADISLPALSLAAKNIDRHGLTEQLELYQGDLWDALPELASEERFDLIICNPPYVNAQSMANLPKEYLAEPELALAGGNDGMDLIRRILRDASAYLKEEGSLVLEIGNEKLNFEAAFPDIPVTWLEVSAGSDQVLLIRAQDLS